MAPTPPKSPNVTLGAPEDGVHMAVYEWQTYRFLLSDGTTMDVCAVRDDSDLRAAVLAATKVERIEGVAHIYEGTTDGR